jgi:hypothetical protein
MSQCLQEIKIADLTDATNYLFEFWDKFDNVEVLTETSIGGICTLDLSLLTPNLLNCNAGEFTLKIYETADLDTPIELTFKSVTYNCFILTFIDSNSSATYEYLR